MSETTRGWIYRILLAVVALAVIYGLVTDEQAAAWIGVAGALLGNGLATVNTTVRKPKG